MSSKREVDGSAHELEGFSHSGQSGNLVAFKEASNKRGKGKSHGGAL